MRATQLVSIVPLLTASLLGAGAALADDDAPAAVKLPPTVYLRGDHDLEKLKQANPDHYARAKILMAAADVVCKPGPLATVPVEAKAKDASCANMLVLTSYPPKRTIDFTLDDVRYVAYVVLTESAAQFQRLPLDPAH
jgi:hypothetical protein